MGFRHLFTVFFLLVIAQLQAAIYAEQKKDIGLGFNVGRTQTTHNLAPEIIVKLMQDNGFDKIKLFEADEGMLKALGGSGIKTMVGIPNNLLERMGNAKEAEDYVAKNISHYLKNKVNIKYVAVGNEPFLKAYKDTYTNLTLPALKNIQNALSKAGIGKEVKATIPFNADIFISFTGQPSDGEFRKDINDLMKTIVKFLKDNSCPLTVNIYPFLAYYYDPSFPIDYAMLDGYEKPLKDKNYTYENSVEASYDTLIWTLEKNGAQDMPVIIGEVGWPTDGNPNANPKTAQRFIQGIVKYIKAGKGTPKRPNNPPEIYLFSLLDENNKSIDPGTFERHWGVLKMDGTLKYDLDLGGGKNLTAAKGVKYLEKQWCVVKDGADESKLNASMTYACNRADCTSLTNGSSCYGLDAKGKASYAFNQFFQTMSQSKDGCDFNGLGTITKTDPSKGNCKFDIMIETSGDGKSPGHGSKDGKNGDGSEKSFANARVATFSWASSVLGGFFVFVVLS